MPRTTTVAIPCIRNKELVTVDVQCYHRVFVFPGWKAPVRVLVHRTIGDKKSWTVSDEKTLGALASARLLAVAVEWALEKFTGVREVDYLAITGRHLTTLKERLNGACVSRITN